MRVVRGRVVAALAGTAVTAAMIIMLRVVVAVAGAALEFPRPKVVRAPIPFGRTTSIGMLTRRRYCFPFPVTTRSRPTLGLAEVVHILWILEYILNTNLCDGLFLFAFLLFPFWFDGR